MFFRLGFLVAASIAAYGFRHAGGRRPPPQPPPTVDVKGEEVEPEEEEEKETEAEEEQVKTVSSVIRATALSEEEEEIERLLAEIDVPASGGTGEVERLRALVREMEEREAKLEGELLEYYGLREQESDVEELTRQLKAKTAELAAANAAVSSLQAERKRLLEEVAQAGEQRRELEAARNRIREMQRQIQEEAKRTKSQLLLLKQQVTGLHAMEAAAADKDADVEKKLRDLAGLEVEVVELRRKNMELQQERRVLSVKLSDAGSGGGDGAEMIGKLRQANEDLQRQVEGLQMSRFSEVEELVYLRWVNACLRYELRVHQAPPGKTTARDLSKDLSPRSREKAKVLMLEYAGSERGQDTDVDETFSSMPSSPGSVDDFDNASVESSASGRHLTKRPSSLIQKFRKWGSRGREEARSGRAVGPLESMMLRNAGDGIAITTFGKIETADDGDVVSSFELMSKTVQGVADEKYPAFRDRHRLAVEREKAIKVRAERARAEKFAGDVNVASRAKPALVLPPKLSEIKENVPSVVAADGDENGSSEKNGSPVVSKMKLAHIEKRSPRVPRPPPKLSSSGGGTTGASSINSSAVPPPPPPPPSMRSVPGGPPPPPPPPGSAKGPAGDSVHRAPELVELYQTLMKRESKRDTLSGSLGSPSTPTAATEAARSNMIGEIENRSTFLLAVKADVETQGEFVQSLAAEVRAASFVGIDDVVAFVNWLDEELSFLVDERAVLKHFDWPESKTDALREAAFEYQDLVKLHDDVSSFSDDPKLPCDLALKKMYSLLEKVEQGVYALLRTRDMAISRYRDYGIPVNWLSDSGIVGKIKLASVQLAKKYMKRVAVELDAAAGTDKEHNREFLLLQGVRFAFRVHQFAGGFDAESMKTFEELRSKMNMQTSSDSGRKSPTVVESET